jgi:hypothetical protein
MNPLFVRLQARLQEVEEAYARSAAMVAAVADAATKVGSAEAARAVTVLKARTVSSVYSGFERILEDIAQTLDGGVPSGPDFHRDLILQMRAAVPNLRPPVIDAHAAELLDELRRFRHVERHAYSAELREADVERVFALTNELRAAFTQRIEDLRRAMDDPG